jgi:hypothetical protein
MHPLLESKLPVELCWRFWISLSVVYAELTRSYYIIIYGYLYFNIFNIETYDMVKQLLLGSDNKNRHKPTYSKKP